MKSKIVTQKKTTEIETNIKGPMMVYKPLTKQEEIELGEWVTADKAKHKAALAKTK